MISKDEFNEYTKTLIKEDVEGNVVLTEKFLKTSKR